MFGRNSPGSRAAIHVPRLRRSSHDRWCLYKSSTFQKFRRCKRCLDAGTLQLSETEKTLTCASHDILRLRVLRTTPNSAYLGTLTIKALHVDPPPQPYNRQAILPKGSNLIAEHIFRSVSIPDILSDSWETQFEKKSDV